MVRTQIQLTEEQAHALKEMAAGRGVSMAELIRQAVERTLEEREEEERWRRALGVMGRFRADPPDVSAKHDQYLAEDYR